MEQNTLIAILRDSLFSRHMYISTSLRESASFPLFKNQLLLRNAQNEVILDVGEERLAVEV